MRHVHDLVERLKTELGMCAHWHASFKISCNGQTVHGSISVQPAVNACWELASEMDAILGTLPRTKEGGNEGGLRGQWMKHKGGMKRARGGTGQKTRGQ